ncbi:MAG: NAD(P)-binding domain-containing protein, partial [Myxococcota bacterium]
RRNEPSSREKMMKISTLGTGNMARNVAGRWAEAGHAVFFGSRDPDKARSVAAEVGYSADGGSNQEAAEFGQVVLHTVRMPPSAFLERPAALEGKILIDLNNRDFPRPAPWQELHPSLAEAVQEAHPSTRVVKGFNTMAMEIFDHEPAQLKELGVSAFLAGNDEDAIDVVSELARQLGLEPVAVGDLGQAWLLEAQADFIRSIMFSGAGAMATVSTRILPAAPSTRFGGRRQGAY